MPNFKDLVAKKGKALQLPGNHRIYLREKGAAWFLEKGSINLFAIERKEGKPEGHRTLITTVGPYSSLFEIQVLADAPYEVVGITETESLIWHVPFESIEEDLIKEPAYIYKWINQLAQVYYKEFVTETNIYLTPPQIATVKEEETFSLQRALTHAEKNKINWIEIEEGEVQFLGYSNLILPKGPFPLTYNGWIKGHKQAIVKALEKTEEWKKGLFAYHQTILNYLQARRKIEDAEEKNRSDKRIKSEEEHVHKALQDMADVLNPLEIKEIVETKAEIFSATCKLIGQYLKTPIDFPQNLPESLPLAELLELIISTSEVRYRQVRLIGKWWKNDSGPILAFYVPEAIPVALLPKKGIFYEMVNAQDQSRIKVNEKYAKELLKTAYTFYSSFPNKIKTGKEVFHFYLKRNIKVFASLFTYSTIAAIIALFPPIATSFLMNQVIPETYYSLLWQISLGLFVAAISSSFFIFFRSLTVARLEGIASNQLQPGLWDRLLKLPVKFFAKHTTGNLIERIFATELIRSLLSGNATRVMFSGVFSLLYLIIMGIYAPALTLISLGFITIGFLITLTAAVFYARLNFNIYETLGEINAFVVQIVAAVGKLRIAGAEKNAFSRWGYQFAKFSKKQLHARHVKNIVTSMNYVLPFLMYLTIFGYVMASEQRYSVGAYLAFNTAFISFYIAITDLSNTLLELTPIFPLWNRAKVIIEAPLEELLEAEHPGKLKGEIHVDEVCFKYAGSESYVLENVSLKANPKEFIGIVGPSGCGKSTLIRLLLGFETPHSGAIYYDDKDLATLTVHDFRKQLGVVLQQEGIIGGSIYENLTCGGNYTPEEIERVLEISGFMEDIESFPMGLHTYLPIGGATLSGGQKQRLLIARALLPNPKILLFDEATSALDNQNQERVIRSINQLDVTRIVIAHRLSTIKNADRIYVMQKGKFIQTGTFEELTNAPGLFSDMLQRQSL